MKNKSLFFNKAVSRPASLEAYSHQNKNKGGANVKLKQQLNVFEGRNGKSVYQ